MNEETAPYAHYFKVGRPVKVAMHLAGNILLEDHAVITALEDDRMTLELWGSGLVERGGAEAGTDVTVITDSGFAIFRCSASLETETSGKIISLILSGGIREKQLREYFRFDVHLPIVYAVPENQTPALVKDEWQMNIIRNKELPPPIVGRHKDGFRIMRWKGQENLPPERVNLSGGGLRFRVPEFTEPGTLMHVDIFLPLLLPRVISVVTKVLRCNEMMLFWTKGDFYSTAMRFHCIDEKDRETIISHIFMEQRRSLQTTIETCSKY
jgi:c-di-GMP-binding flagellar brake protein YcgR